MVEASDWILAVFTVVLAGATIALAWHTARLVKVTKQISEASERNKIMPSLIWNTVQPLSDGANTYVRFSVKNVGRGHARYSSVVARLVTRGKELQVMPHSSGDIIETDNLFYWDIYGAKVNDEIEIQVSYADMQAVQYPLLTHTFIVH